MKKVLVCVMAFGLMFAQACGGDDDGGPSGAKKLSDLTQTEAKEVCMKYGPQFNELMNEGVCLGISIMMTGGDEALCDAALDSCLVDAAKEPDDSCDDLIVADVKDCDVTVAEWETCMSDTLKLYEGAFDGYECGMDPTLLEGEGEEEPDDPASCKALEAKCPQMMEE